MRKILLILLLLGLLSINVIANNITTKETKIVKYNHKEKSITIVWTDLSNEKIRIESVLANNQIGATDGMLAIYKNSSDTDGKPIAAINGSFFSAYTDFQPQGSLIVDGATRHISNTGSSFTIDNNNHFDVNGIFTKIEGSTKSQWTWPNNWYAWNINHWYNSNNAVMIFDHFYNGPKPKHPFTSIVVVNKVIKNISKGDFDIPDEGFLLLTNDSKMIDKFHIGDSADFRIKYYNNDYTHTSFSGDGINLSKIRTSVSAGPTLVKNGVIVVDPVTEGFTEEKINSAAATRSLIGLDQKGRLGMAVVDHVSVYDLAKIALELGMIKALNLDGGASSGLIYEGQYVHQPGRHLSNIVVIKELKEKPIKIKLNNRELFFDTEPYLNHTYNRTLVPLRGIVEALGATVGWDQATSSIRINRSDTELLLQIGRSSVMVNGQPHTMDIPVVLKNSRSYVPIRFVTEFLGGQVKWIQETQTVRLDLSK